MFWPQAPWLRWYGLPLKITLRTRPALDVSFTRRTSTIWKLALLTHGTDVVCSGLPNYATTCHCAANATPVLWSRGWTMEDYANSKANERRLTLSLIASEIIETQNFWGD